MKKNLIFIMTDQQRADTVGTAAGGVEITPNLNRLAEKSTVFERAYDACPLCVPARTALATGINPLKNGMMLNDLAGTYAEENITLHQRLSENGYEVAHVGVNHISVKPPLKEAISFAAWECDGTYAEYAAARGLNISRSELDSVQVDELAEGRYERHRYSNARVSLWPYELQDFKDVWFADKAVRYLKKKHEKPFALFLAMWAPHPPLIVPEAYWNRFKDADIRLPDYLGVPAAGEPPLRRRGAAAGLGGYPPEHGWEEGFRAHYALSNLCDHQIGKVLGALEEAGLEEDTVIVFTTDHGEQMGQHGMYQKMEMYEPAVRVPAIFHVPGMEPQRLGTPISHLDFVPTILDVLDVRANSEGLEGSSLRPCIETGSNPPQRDVFSVYCGNHKFGDQRRMIVRYDHKYVYDGICGELYDLKNDPLEMCNLCGKGEYRELEQSLRDSLKQWCLENGDTHCFQEKKQKNLLVVFADQWRREAMGFAGKDPVLTPNMDAFAEASVYCTDAVSTFPLCSPHRASMLTGRHPLSTGVFTNCKAGLSMRLKDSERGIAQCLKERGYRTGYIGKWHLDEPEQNISSNPESKAMNWDAYTPPGIRRHGFDYWYSYGACDQHLSPHYWRDSPEQICIREWSPKHETDMAIKFMEKQKQEGPFALMVSWNPPHSPYDQVPQNYLDLYEEEVPLKENVERKDIHHHTYEYAGYSKEELQTVTKQYYAAVSGLDDQFGRLVKWLKDNRLFDDTLIVLSADHGDMLGSHGLIAKHVWYEESIGIPLVIGGAGLLSGVCRTVIGSPDLMPTLLGLLEQPVPSETEGVNCAQNIRDRSFNKNKSCYLAACPGRDVFLKRFQAAGKNPMDYGWRGIRTPEYTYIIDAGYETEAEVKRLLYNLRTDPLQMKPMEIAEAEKNETACILEKKLVYWLRKQKDGFLQHLAKE